LPARSITDHTIKNNLSDRTKQQRCIQQFNSFNAELAVHILVNAGFAEKIVLVYPVEKTKTNYDQYAASRNERWIEIGEPNRFNYLCIFFTHTIFGFLHQIVCLLLGQIFITEVQLTFDYMENMPRINQPNQRNQKGVEKKHNRLLFHNSITLFVYILQCYSLHQQSHHCSGEEKTESVL